MTTMTHASMGGSGLRPWGLESRRMAVQTLIGAITEGSFGCARTALDANADAPTDVLHALGGRAD